MNDDREPRKETIRVAHVGGYDPDAARGPSKAIAGMLQHLPRYGVEVELWHLVRGVEEVTWHEIDGIPLLRLPRRRRLASFMIGLPRQTREALGTRSTHVDLVHFHSVFIADNARASTLLRVPYVISPRSGYNQSVLHGRNRLAKSIWLATHERRYILSARALHAVSVQEAVELERLVPSERIFYVPNAVDQHVLDRPIKDHAGRTLLFLGRLSVQHKGIDLLLDGYSRFLRDSGDKSSNLVIAGPDYRNNRRRIEDQIRAVGVQDRVSLAGGVFGEAKWNLIDRAYAVVLTSRWEGMPFALLEAMAAGRPVLVTPETNLGASVEEYRAGVQVSGDAEAIAAGIRELLDIPRKAYVGMRHRARQLVQENFTWDHIASDLANRYRGIVERADEP